MPTALPRFLYCTICVNRADFYGAPPVWRGPFIITLRQQEGCMSSTARRSRAGARIPTPICNTIQVVRQPATAACKLAFFSSATALSDSDAWVSMASSACHAKRRGVRDGRCREAEGDAACREPVGGELASSPAVPHQPEASTPARAEWAASQTPPPPFGPEVRELRRKRPPSRAASL